MSLARLHVFEWAAREGAFAAAAEALGMTASAVSQQIAQLEGELGVALFVRTTRGIELTEAGRALLARAKPLLAEARNLHAELARPQGPGLTPFRIGCPVEPMVAKLVEHLCEQLPQLPLELTVDRSDALGDLVADGLLDLAVAFEPDGPNGWLERPISKRTDIRVELAADDPFVAVMPDDHGAAGRQFTLDDLALFPLVGDAGDHGMEVVVRTARAADVEPRFLGHQATDYETTVALVRIEQAPALVPRLAALTNVDGLAVERLAWRPPVRAVLVITQQRDLEAPHALAHAAVRDAVAADRSSAHGGAGPGIRARHDSPPELVHARTL